LAFGTAKGIAKHGDRAGRKNEDQGESQDGEIMGRQEASFPLQGGSLLLVHSFGELQWQLRAWGKRRKYLKES
jgi:hypothetical protein